jgi:hypothetical protein
MPMSHWPRTQDSRPSAPITSCASMRPPSSSSTAAPFPPQARRRARPLTILTFWAKRSAASSARSGCCPRRSRPASGMGAEGIEAEMAALLAVAIDAIASTGATRAMSSAPQTFREDSSLCAVWFSAYTRTSHGFSPPAACVPSCAARAGGTSRVTLWPAWASRGRLSWRSRRCRRCRRRCCGRGRGKWLEKWSVCVMASL